MTDIILALFLMGPDPELKVRALLRARKLSLDAYLKICEKFTIVMLDRTLFRINVGDGLYMSISCPTDGYGCAERHLEAFLMKGDINSHDVGTPHDSKYGKRHDFYDVDKLIKYIEEYMSE